MKKNNFVYISLTALALLAGCGGAATESSGGENSSSENTSETRPEGEYTLVQAFEKLAKDKNFTIVLENTMGDELAKYQYNPDFFHNVYNNSGYLIKDESVYAFSIDGTTVRNGEKVEKDLFGTLATGMVYDFSCVDIASIDSSIYALQTSKKTIMQPLAYLAGFTTSDYARLESINIGLNNRDVEGLTVEFKFKDSNLGEYLYYYMFVKDVDQTTNPVIDKFISEGTLIEVPEDLARTRSLFELDNFTQTLQDGNGIRYDIFNEDYFIPLYTQETLEQDPILAAYQVGYMEMLYPDKQLNITGKPLIYDDTFYFNYMGSYDDQTLPVTIVTRENPQKPGYAQGAFTTRIDDISKAMNYPKNLDLFHSFQSFTEFTPDSSYQGYHGYETSDILLIDDFLANFNLTGGFDNYGGVAKLQILTNYTTEDKDCKMTFNLVIANGGYYNIDFSNFGTTEFQPFELIKDQIESM